MMPHVNSIHDELCRCRECKPPRMPDGQLYDAIGQQVSPIDSRAEIARDRLAMGAMGLVAVLALGMHWAGWA